MAARTVRLIVGIRRVVPSHPLVASVFACTRVSRIFCRYAARMKGGLRGKEEGGKERARKKKRTRGAQRVLPSFDSKPSQDPLKEDEWTREDV